MVRPVWYCFGFPQTRMNNDVVFLSFSSFSSFYKFLCFSYYFSLSKVFNKVKFFSSSKTFSFTVTFSIWKWLLYISENRKRNSLYAELRPFISFRYFHFTKERSTLKVLLSLLPTFCFWTATVWFKSFLFEFSLDENNEKWSFAATSVVYFSAE